MRRKKISPPSHHMMQRKWAVIPATFQEQPKYREFGAVNILVKNINK